MYTAKRPFLRPAIFILILTSIFLAACSGGIANTNWPGLSTDGKRIYIAYGPGVIAYDVEKQTQVWSFPEEPNRTLQFYAAPSVQNGRIIIGDYGASGGMFSPGVIASIYALQDTDSSSPELLWQQDGLAQDHIVAPPLQVEDTVYVGTADNKLLALDANTGSLQWQYELENSVWAQPAYKNGIVYVASLDKAVHAVDAQSGNRIWRQELQGAIASQPVVDSGLIYVSSFDGKVHALDEETGQEKWAAEAENWVWGAPALNGDTLYYADIDGNVYAVTADSGERLWVQQVEGAVTASPIVVNDTLYIVSEGNKETGQGVLSALDVTNGQVKWQKTTPAPLFATPVVVDNVIVVAMQSEQALLMAFDLVTGGQQWAFLPAASE